MPTTHYTIPQLVLDAEGAPVVEATGGRLLDKSTGAELAVQELVTGSAKSLTTNSYGILHPFQNPDGHMIAFADFGGAQTSIYADEVLDLLAQYADVREEASAALDTATQALAAAQASGGISGKFIAPVPQNADGTWPDRPSATNAYPLLIPRNPSQPVTMPTWWTSDVAIMAMLTGGTTSTTTPPGDGGTNPPPPTPTLLATASAISPTSAKITWTTTETPASGWTVSRDGVDPSGDGAWTGTVTNGAAREFTFLSLRSSNTYNFTVSCVASNGQTLSWTVQHKTSTISSRYSTTFTNSGTSSDYHLYTAVTGNLKGLVVYLDGDAMYGHLNRNSTWALGGTSGIPARAGARGYATLSIQTPDRSGERTWWESGTSNAVYAIAVINAIRAELGVSRTWLVGYSGGSQLITKFLIPAHSAQFTSGGGAVITGGGGAPSGTPSINATLKTVFPLHWVTGSLDNGAGTSDGYNALADAKSGHSWYSTRGYMATREEPSGWDHDSLGTQFGNLLAAQLDKFPAA